VNLNELYTQIITENSRSKENRHPVEGATHSLEGVNPSCGDDITLQLRVKDGKIEDAGFIGSSCAISQASASLMIDLVKGRTVEDAHRLISLYFQMIKGKITPEELDDLEDVAALQGIAHVPARVKCAVLAWHTLEEALDGEGKTDKVTTEESGGFCLSGLPRGGKPFCASLFFTYFPRLLFFSPHLWYNIQIYKLKSYDCAYREKGNVPCVVLLALPVCVNSARPSCTEWRTALYTAAPIWKATISAATTRARPLRWASAV